MDQECTTSGPDTPELQPIRPKTTRVALDIVCPAWCTISADEHVGELWDNAGNCLHQTSVDVDDLAGHQVPLEEPRFGAPVRISLSSNTRPDNVEAESPVLIIEGRECTVAQALAIADALRDLVAVYRAAGGVA